MLACQSQALSFGSSAPHAMVDVMGEGVVETFASHSTSGTDSLRTHDPRAIARVEHVWRVVATGARFHPIHHSSVPSRNQPMIRCNCELAMISFSPVAVRTPCPF